MNRCCAAATAVRPFSLNLTAQEGQFPRENSILGTNCCFPQNQRREKTHSCVVLVQRTRKSVHKNRNVTDCWTAASNSPTSDTHVVMVSSSTLVLRWRLKNGFKPLQKKQNNKSIFTTLLVRPLQDDTKSLSKQHRYIKQRRERTALWGITGSGVFLLDVTLCVTSPSTILLPPATTGNDQGPNTRWLKMK